MFAWVGAKFDVVLSNYVLGVVTSLMAAITPVVLTAMTLWVGLYGWAVLRHEVPETLPNFVWRTFKIGLVLALALQSGVYIATVADSANSLAMGVASSFLPATADPLTITSPYVLLDRFNDTASQQTADIMKEASMFRLDLVLAAVVFSIGSVVFLCVALFVVTLSKVLLSFVIAVGPLFVLSLAWRPTARFFDSWLSMVLNTVVLTWFAFFALGISNFMGEAIFEAIRDGGGFLGGTFNVLGEATRYCVLMILMAIVCLQAPSLASALTGGVAVQQGVQMVQNTLMVAGIRSGSRGAVAPAAAGAGLPYAAGHATGAAAAVAARAARQGASAARVAAYRIAALRGRT